jgi:hypothetical protein
MTELSAVIPQRARRQYHNDEGLPTIGKKNTTGNSGGASSFQTGAALASRGM